MKLFLDLHLVQIDDADSLSSVAATGYLFLRISAHRPLCPLLSFPQNASIRRRRCACDPAAKKRVALHAEKVYNLGRGSCAPAHFLPIDKTGGRNTHSWYTAGMFLEAREECQALDKLLSWIENLQ